MGEEINTVEFSDDEFSNFKKQLEKETALLASWFKENRLSAATEKAGFELEVWIVDQHANPVPLNDALLEELNENNELVSPELSRFNIELNGQPEKLEKFALSQLEKSLEKSWRHCTHVVNQHNASLIMIGIIPSVTEQQLVLKNMSKLKRYSALNERVLALRRNKPLKLDINAKENLKTIHHNVMLESATTSFQLHWQIPIKKSVRAYNASIIASAATVAISANAPYLFSKDLWDETRIPLFEQAVEVGGFEGAAFGPTKRVSFGTGFAKQSLMEVFQENLEHFPILLPVKYNTPSNDLRYLRLHNGTLWRWNRPLIGFDQITNTAHVRIEHRVMAAAPTLIDNIANAAFYYGLANYLANLQNAPELELAFSTARDNFYRAAKSSLQANVKWLNDYNGKMKVLLEKQLINNAEQGLYEMNIAKQDIEYYINIIKQRVGNEQHGANWLRAYKRKHACSMRELSSAYAKQQNTEQPVHTWPI